MNNPKILIVEDSKITQETLKKNFTELGCELKIASDAEKAQIILNEKFEPHIIILDLNLPGKSGPEFYHDIAKNYKGIVVPFTAHWGSNEDPMEDLAIEWLSSARNQKQKNTLQFEVFKPISKGKSEDVTEVPIELIMSVGNALIRKNCKLSPLFEIKLKQISKTWTQTI